MSHVSTLRLHQFRLGELDALDAGTISHHLADCDRCAERLGVQRDARVAFLREPVPAALLPRDSLWERLRRPWTMLLLVPALAAALAIGTLSAGGSGTTDTRVKGGLPLLEAWVQTGSTARPLYTGERVRAGTRIQLKFDPGKHRFVTLAGRDSSGAVEVYGTVPARGPGLATAPFALTLDSARGEQAFFAVLSDTRPDSATVATALEQDPVTFDHAEVASLVVQKE